MTPERLRLVAPPETGIYLYRPPFATLAAIVANDAGTFWSEFGALEQVDAELTLVLGDFGLGADAVFALDYRADRSSPPVIRLHWRKRGTANGWVRCADTFAGFATLLGLVQSDDGYPSA